MHGPMNVKITIGKFNDRSIFISDVCLFVTQRERERDLNQILYCIREVVYKYVQLP